MDLHYDYDKPWLHYDYDKPWLHYDYDKPWLHYDDDKLTSGKWNDGVLGLFCAHCLG